jgi:hypothetical protein
VTEVIQLLSEEFGKEAPLTVPWGKVHDYLEMQIDYSTPRKVKIRMTDYIDGMLDELPAWIDGEAATPASNQLYVVNENNPQKLEREESEIFYHNTAKLLYLCKQAQLDLQTVAAFFITHVKGPDQDDYKKLGRTMWYIRSTQLMLLMLEANDMHIVKWWVDALFVVHPGMKSYTGGVRTLGQGSSLWHINKTEACNQELSRSGVSWSQ